VLCAKGALKIICVNAIPSLPVSTREKEPQQGAVHGACRFRVRRPPWPTSRIMVGRSARPMMRAQFIRRTLARGKTFDSLTQGKGSCSQTLSMQLQPIRAASSESENSEVYAENYCTLAQLDPPRRPANSTAICRTGASARPAMFSEMGIVRVSIR
jgi:hypothetical protein